MNTGFVLVALLFCKEDLCWNVCRTKNSGNILAFLQGLPFLSDYQHRRDCLTTTMEGSI